MSEAEDEIDARARLAELEARIVAQQAELEVSREEAATAGIRLLDALESLSEGFVLVNAERRISVVNEQLHALFGDDAEIWSPGGALAASAHALGERGYAARFEDEDEDVSVADAFALLVDEARPSALLQFGDEKWMTVKGRATFDGGCVITFSDISDLQRQKAALTAQSQLLQATLDAIHEGICAFSASGSLVAWNGRLCDVLDLPADALADGRSHVDFLTLLANRGLFGEGAAADLVAKRREALGAGAMMREHEVLSGERHIEISEFAMPDGGHVATFTDVTDRRTAEQRLLIQATTDELTGLPNRVLGIDRLRSAVMLAKRSGAAVGVLFVDLDGFKRVNDTLGHAAGDALLQEAAHRMQTCLRESDTVARLGGDEFLIVAPEIALKSQCVVIAEKVIGRLVEPFSLDGQDIFISCSIGISYSDGDGDSAETLLRNADIAMYEAKAAGKNTFHYFSSQMNDEAQRRLDIEIAFRKAVGNNELRLDYQPIVDARDGYLIGAEALLRWDRPGHGLVRPDLFIPVVEATNLIVPMGEWVLRQACRDAASWLNATGRALTVAVNVSARQFRDPDFVSNVQRILEDEKLPPTSLRIELTETLLVQDPPRARQVLGALKSLDIGIAMDDFGTGYSSLGYIKNFPFDTIKVDKSFISGIATSHEDRAITRTVLAMAKSLKLRSVAEGVETQDQLDFLQDHDCDCAQGYLFGKPNVSADLVRRALAEAADGRTEIAS